MQFHCVVVFLFFISLEKSNCNHYGGNGWVSDSPPIDTIPDPEPISVGEPCYSPPCYGSSGWDQPTNPVWIYVSGFLFLLIIVVIVVGGVIYRRRQVRLARLLQTHNFTNISHGEQSAKTHMDTSHRKMKNDYIDELRKADGGNCKKDPWEIPIDNLKVFEHEKLGSGAFCFVYKGKVEGKAPVCKLHPSMITQKFENCEVAVKKLPEYADNLAKSDFIQEIDFMKRIGYHTHLVSMIGCFTDPCFDPCLVIEYCSNGDLLKYIRNRRLEIVDPAVDDELALRFKDLLSFAWQISDGMDFLSSKGCIHRDIAARNVLVDERKVAKIGDFGLCRLMDSTIYTTRGGRLPIKWMAIESLDENEYSIKSDVWSYGVLLYELFSLGAVPYSWIQPSEMAEYLRSGERLSKPQHCDDDVYSIMQECWKAQPEERPLFSDLKTKFGTLLSYATEEYGYLDVRKSDGGKYYPLISNNSSGKEQVVGDESESTAPTEISAKTDANDPETMYGSEAKDILNSIVIREENLACP